MTFNKNQYKTLKICVEKSNFDNSKSSINYFTYESGVTLVTV